MFAIAAEAGATPNILEFNFTIIIQILTFVIVWMVLSKFLFPVLKKSMAERADRIQKSLSDADALKVEGERVLAERREELTRARAEAQRIVGEAAGKAEEVAEEIRAAARGEAEKIVAEARERAEGERGRVLEEARSEAVRLGVLIAERLLKENLDKGRQERLAREFIANLPS